jgi:hypothetical protein
MAKNYQGAGEQLRLVIFPITATLLSTWLGDGHLLGYGWRRIVKQDLTRGPRTAGRFTYFGRAFKHPDMPATWSTEQTITF